MIGDKGYDSDPIRDDLEERGAEPVIPTKANRKVQRPVDRKTYSLRNRIERFFNKIKNSRRVATRYDKLAFLVSCSSQQSGSGSDLSTRPRLVLSAISP